MSTTALTNILNKIKNIRNFGETVYATTAVTLTTSDSVNVYISYYDADNKYTNITITPSSTVSFVSIQGGTLSLRYDYSAEEGFPINFATSASGTGFYDSTDYNFTINGEISYLTLELVDTATINLS